MDDLIKLLVTAQAHAIPRLGRRAEQPVHWDIGGADYNDTRPHSQLGWKTPSEFAINCEPHRDLAPRY
jgi:putative transposase